ncbi:MAG: radical SAM protein, partial [Candidatus Erginobacter occultus]|nr:radical SAM protein [Candidatus Erginobacter occultus]
MKTTGRGSGNRGLLSNSDQANPTAPPGRFYLRTFGCQMNRHDSELVSGLLQARGWIRVDDEKDSDLILLNTCSVRGRPEEKVWGRLARYRGLKADRPGLILGVLGCMARIRGDSIRRRFPEVDLVLGPEELDRLAEELAARAASIPEPLPEPEAVRESPLSAWVTVTRGCDNFCSYCVVPYARGREVSRPPSEILAEVGRLGQEGYREVTLLGQNVNSYRGAGTTGEEVDFPGLLRRLDPVPGIER